VKIGIGSDHGGFSLKRAIINRFTEISFDDVGTYDQEPCDYPDYVSIVCSKIQKGDLEYGIVICGSGIGASIAANKINGIRAALCCNEYMAEMSRRHNNANVLVLGGRVLADELSFKIVERWINSSYEQGRHQRRLDKIHEIEKSQKYSA
jgi:ribose 5-phosphate isomerase B